MQNHFYTLYWMTTLTETETTVRTKIRTKRKTSGKKVINGPALYFLSKSPSSRAKGLFSELILKRWRWSCWRGRWRCTGTQWREGSPGVHRSSCGLLSLPRPLLPSGNPPFTLMEQMKVIDSSGNLPLLPAPAYRDPHTLPRRQPSNVVNTKRS